MFMGSFCSCYTPKMTSYNPQGNMSTYVHLCFPCRMSQTNHPDRTEDNWGSSMASGRGVCIQQQAKLLRCAIGPGLLKQLSTARLWYLILVFAVYIYMIKVVLPDAIADMVANNQQTTERVVRSQIRYRFWNHGPSWSQQKILEFKITTWNTREPIGATWSCRQTPSCASEI